MFPESSTNMRYTDKPHFLAHKTVLKDRHAYPAVECGKEAVQAPNAAGADRLAFSGLLQMLGQFPPVPVARLPQRIQRHERSAAAPCLPGPTTPA